MEAGRYYTAILLDIPGYRQGFTRWDKIKNSFSSDLYVLINLTYYIELL
jgi:hypothetical protein